MGGLKVDPAIERWGSMRETSARHFKVTRTAARNGLIWGLVVPLALYELSIVEFNKRAEASGQPRKYPSIFN
eukprot:m.10375 g.10375  ORF g.10375 m.10375 type:complete len:72 (-) comp6580_c0_seq1:293-508(-)